MAATGPTVEEMWALLEEVVTDVHMRAVSAAFALVACADAEIADREIRRFSDVILKAEGSEHIDQELLQETFRALAEAIIADPDAGRAKAFEALAELEGDIDGTSLVVRAAQVAIVADGVLREREEVAFRELCGKLGLDPEHF